MTNANCGEHEAWPGWLVVLTPSVALGDKTKITSSSAGGWIIHCHEGRRPNDLHDNYARLSFNKLTGIMMCSPTVLLHIMTDSEKHGWAFSVYTSNLFTFWQMMLVSLALHLTMTWPHNLNLNFANQADGCWKCWRVESRRREEKGHVIVLALL